MYIATTGLKKNISSNIENVITCNLFNAGKISILFKNMDEKYVDFVNITPRR